MFVSDQIYILQRRYTMDLKPHLWNLCLYKGLGWEMMVFAVWNRNLPNKANLFMVVTIKDHVHEDTTSISII